MFRLDKYIPSAWLLGSIVYFQRGYLFTPLGEIIYIVSLLNPEPLTVCLWEDRTIGLIAPYIGFPDVYENMQT